MRAAAAVALLLVAPALAQVPTVGNVTFNTNPPYVYVYEVTADSVKPKPLGRSGVPIGNLERTDNFTVAFGYPPDGPDTRRIMRIIMSEAVKQSLYPTTPIDVELSLNAYRQYVWETYVERWVPVAGMAAMVGLAAAVGLYVQVWVPRRETQRRKALRARRWESLAPSLDLQDPLAGRRLGPWRLISRLGAGGMAAVYEALPDETLDSEEAVAVKVVHAQAAGTAEVQQRFRQEAAVCARLHHPNLIRIRDAGDQDGQLYLAMELVKGRSLRTALRPSGVSQRRVRELFRPILLGLGAAHAQGIVHRDLKPDNVMLTDDGRVVVMDFGLARRPDLVSITATGAVMGTPAYMAPEQIKGEDLDGRADQYALGVMIYEFLTGGLPFAGELDSMQLLMKHLTEQPLPLTGFKPELQEAVQRMLAKSPEDRFPDLEAARAALQF